jgi:RNA polymerase sigma-70 factor (ECF subfamily)
VQEAFLSAWRAIGKFRGDARFSTWLCGIVLNHAKSHMAQRAARSRNEGASLDDPAISADGHLLNEPCCREASVIEQMEKRERDAKVQECIITLEGEQREVLVLRDIQGFSYEEIGVMLKLPEGTVKSRLFRARNALKDGLLKVFGDLT